MATPNTSKSGPSSELWEQNRALIVSTYLNGSLKAVQEVMEKKGFKASKRMYDTQFKKWRVSKNQKADQKDDILAKVDTSALLHQNPTGNPTKDRELRNLVRYAKAKKRKEGHRSNRSNPKQSSPPLIPTVQVSAPDTDFNNWSVSMITEGYPMTAEPLQIDPLVSTNLLTDQSLYPPYSPTYAGSSPGTVFDDEYRVIDTGVLDTDVEFSDMSLYADMWSYDPNAMIYPNVPMMISDGLSTKTFTILKSITDFVQWQVTHGKDPERSSTPLRQATDPKGDKFWSNLKHGIYLLKNSEFNTAAVAFSEANQVIDKAVTDHTTPFTFVLELLTTLSQVNTRTCPRVRQTFIQMLSTVAHHKLSAKHPISLICHNLQTEMMRESHHTCDEILYHYLRLVSQTLGGEHPVTFKSKRAAVALLRRDRQFMRATQEGTLLLTSTRKNSGKGSIQARDAATELAHVHIDEKNFPPAIALCSEIIGLNENFGATMAQIATNQPINNTANGMTNTITTSVPLYTTDFPGPIFRDKRAVHTMGSIAKIYDEIGQKAQSIKWSNYAAELALDVWGPDNVITLDLVEKLCSRLRGCGSSDIEIADVRKRFALRVLKVEPLDLDWSQPKEDWAQI